LSMELDVRLKIGGFYRILCVGIFGDTRDEFFQIIAVHTRELH